MNRDPVVIELYADLRDIIDRAYAVGFQAGCVATRDRIMQAVQQPMAESSSVAESPMAPRASATESHDDGTSRAPRGALRAAIQEVLRRRPGAYENFLQTEVPRIDPRVSGKSVGGELRRMKGNLYRQDGYKWFNIETPATQASPDFGGQTGADTPAADTVDEDKVNAAA